MARREAVLSLIVDHWGGIPCGTSRCSRCSSIASRVDQVVDHIDEWVTNDAADGFNVCFGDASGSLDVFVDHAIPELQHRGLFQTDYRGGPCARTSDCRGGKTASRYLPPAGVEPPQLRGCSTSGPLCGPK